MSLKASFFLSDFTAGDDSCFVTAHPGGMSQSPMMGMGGTMAMSTQGMMTAPVAQVAMISPASVLAQQHSQQQQQQQQLLQQQQVLVAICCSLSTLFSLLAPGLFLGTSLPICPS